MYKRKIVFHSEKDVCLFVKEAEKCNFNIDMYHNHIFVDAKSILGVIGFGLYKILTISYDVQKPSFENVVGKFEVLSTN